MSLVSINVDVTTVESDVEVTAEPGGDGTALSISDQTVAVTLANVDGQPFEYRVDSGEWQQVSGRGSGRRIVVDLSATTVSLRMVWPGSTSVPVRVTAEEVSGALLASGSTIASGGGGGGGAEAFTDLSDAPETITPNAVLVGNEAGELVMPSDVKIARYVPDGSAGQSLTLVASKDDSEEHVRAVIRSDVSGVADSNPLATSAVAGFSVAAASDGTSLAALTILAIAQGNDQASLLISLEGGILKLTGLPEADPAVADALYWNGNVLTRSAP